MLGLGYINCLFTGPSLFFLSPIGQITHARQNMMNLKLNQNKKIKKNLDSL